MVKIGYVGLGAMGGSLSRHLIGKHELRVLDRNPAAVDQLRQAGAQSSADGAELARDCDIIFLCLPRSVDVREAIFGRRGLAEGLAPGKLIIDQTSGVPAQTAAIAAELAKHGVMMLDAPVSGGIPAAQAGKVTIIASGPSPGWNRAEPLLRSMSDKVFRCSDRVGDGQALKLVNNAIGAGYRMATLELVALGRKAGLGLAEMVAALNEGPGANFTSRNMLVGLIENRSTTNFALALMIKDLNEALALGASTSAAMPITQGARSLMQIGLNSPGPGRQARRCHCADREAFKRAAAGLRRAPLGGPAGPDRTGDGGLQRGGRQRMRRHGLALRAESCRDGAHPERWVGLVGRIGGASCRVGKRHRARAPMVPGRCRGGSGRLGSQGRSPWHRLPVTGRGAEHRAGGDPAAWRIGLARLHHLRLRGRVGNKLGRVSPALVVFLWWYLGPPAGRTPQLAAG